MRFVRTWTPGTVLAVLALSLVGCPKNPATGERQLILVSERQMAEMGRQSARQVEATIGLYPDSGLQAYVSHIGKQIAAKTERPDLPWSFEVVDDPAVNAFALPGGYIFVTRGILTYFTSEAELAAVLGHESGHVTARHSAEQVSRAQFAQLGLGVGSIFVPEIGQYGQLLSAGLGLLFLKFSRDDERQADALGFRYMTRANYDPRQMVDVFTMLNRVSQASGSSLPDWLSTHPNPEDRRERVQQEIDSAGIPDGEVDRNAYLRHVDGVVFGENPRNGYFQGSLFLHPDLEFQLRFPDRWKTQNMPRAVVGVSPGQDAVLQLTLSGAATPEEGAREFLSQEGIRSGGTTQRDVNGLPSVWAPFAAQTEQGPVRGLVAFVRHQDHVFQILGYTGADRIGSYEPVLRQAIGSFRRLTDREALNVQPRRVQLVTLDRSMTLAQFNERNPSTIPVETLAVINGVEAGDMLEAGRIVKRVVGGRLPKTEAGN